MKRKLKIAAGLLVAVLVSCAAAFYLALRPGVGPALRDSLPGGLDAALHISDPAAALDAISGWEPLKALAGGRLARSAGVELSSGLPPELVELAPVVLGTECALGIEVVAPRRAEWIFLSKIGFGFAVREWALGHFGPEGMVSHEPLEWAPPPHNRQTLVDVGGPVGLVHYVLVGDLLIASSSGELLARGLSKATGASGAARAGLKLPKAGHLATASARSLRDAVPDLTGVPPELLTRALSIAGLPWPAGAAAVTLDGDPGRRGAASLEAVVGFDPALLPRNAMRNVFLETSEWTGVEAVPADAIFHWSWRAATGWHLVNLFIPLAREAGQSPKDQDVMLEIYRVVLDRLGPHFPGDYACFATLQEEKGPVGGYPAVTWLFRIDDADEVRREMLAGASRWATGVRSGGGGTLDFPYLEEEEYRGVKMYHLMGGFVHREHGYDPCYAVAKDLLICSSSSGGLKRSLDALDGRAKRLELGALPGPAGGRSFVVHLLRPESMKQVSDLYGYQVELYRRYSLTPEEALTDSTDYAARYEIFEEIAGLVDRLVLTGRYDDGGLLRMWARLTPASGAAGPRGEQAVAP